MIGAGWAARFTLNGLDVVVYDPDPDIKGKLHHVQTNAARAYRALFPSGLGDIGSLRVAPSLEVMCESVDFIQESLPERESLKIDMLNKVSEMLGEEIIIASSTSGLLPSRLQSSLVYPQNFVIGHPFNPVYLIPLVEICGGQQTSEATCQRVHELYHALGMHPLRVRKEIDGFIADRLMEAMWREALWLVNDDIATVEEIDDAIRFGPGLRWAMMGSFLTYRLAGGEQGMHHFMAQFGAALQWPWTKLTDVPNLSQAFLQRIAEQSDAQAGGQSIQELEALRDDTLVALISALHAQGVGAGRTLDHYETLMAARRRRRQERSPTEAYPFEKS